jgi:ubiquinone/menaquinone biosynthesis C-methylase UbiE
MAPARIPGRVHDEAGVMYAIGPDLYDAIYKFKDYEAESARIIELVEQHAPGARTLLDVACGTGEHARFLSRRFEVDGLDISEEYLEAARRKHPAGNFTVGNMTKFDLGRGYDVVTCLFSAIGHVKDAAETVSALKCFQRHLNLAGVAIVEPWIEPQMWKPGGQVHVHTGTAGDRTVVRMSNSGRDGANSTLEFHYLIGDPGRIEHHVEHHVMPLFTRAEMTRMFESAGFDVSYDERGLMDRGLYIARPR